MQSVQERLIAAQQPFELGPVAQRLIGAQRKQTFTDEMDRTALQTIGGLLGAATMPRRTVDTALQALGVDEKTRGAASAMFKSVQPGHEDIAALGQQFEDVAATIPTGTPTTTSELGSAVGSSAILAPLGLVGGPPLVGAASAAMESSQLLDEAKQAGASPLRQLVAAGAGAAIGSTEAMGSEEALGALGKTLMGAPRELRGRIVTAIASAMATGWAGEAGEEIFQGLGEDAVRQWAIQDPRAQRNLQQWIDRYGEIAVHQGLPAGLVGMFTSGLATATEQTLARSQGNRIRPGAQVSPGDSGPRAVSEVSPEVSPEVAPASPELANREATASAAGNLEIPSNDQPPVGPVDQGGAAAQPEAAMPPEAAQAAETGRATLERQNQRPVRLSANPNEEARAGRQFGRMMGFDVNLVESDDGAPLKYPGVTLGDNVTVDANSTLDMSVDQVVAHEAAHVLAGRSPSAFEAYLRKFTRLTPEQIARARAMYAERFGEGAPTGALADEEAVATLHEDFVGALRLAFTDEATLREGLRDRTVWEAVVDTMKRIANVLGGKFKLSIDQRIAALQERLLAEGDTGEVPAQIAAEMALEFKRATRMVNEAKSALASEDAKFQAAWHGTPHDFDKFSMEKIGTGEGAQAYGHGLYFAEKRGVAEAYREALTPSLRVGDQTLQEWYMDSFPPSATIDLGVLATDMEAALTVAAGVPGDAVDVATRMRMSGDVIDALKEMDRQGVIAEPVEEGHLYKVELAPQEDEYLLWDKPFSEQSEKVQAALQSILPSAKTIDTSGWTAHRNTQYGSRDWNVVDESGNTVNPLLISPKVRTAQEAIRIAASRLGIVDETTGKDLYELARDVAFERASSPDKHRGISAELGSKLLREAGIRGIKYLDRGSRGAGEGTYNYVIFDDKDVSIVAKFAARPSEESSARPEDEPKTGVKNAAVEEEMVRMGFDAPTHGPLLAFKTAWAEAKAKFDADPTVGAHLITQLDADPRPTSAREGAILALEMNRLILARDAAINRHIIDPSPLNAEALFQAQAAYALAGEVVTRIGTETGQALAFRKMMVKRDYSLAAMERARRSANQGAELTDEQRAETKALYDKLADLERQLASAQAAGRSAAATTSIDETIAQVRKERKPRAVKGADVKLASLEDELAKMLEAEGIPVQPKAKFAARPDGGPELNPKILAKVTEVASAFRDLGYETFEDFSTHATARFGDAITPYLQSAWDETQKVVTKKADDARRFAANALVRKILAIGARWQTRYLGNKRQFFDRNAETLAVLAENGHLKDVSTIFDMYAGGGTYGLSYIEAGLTPDVKRIVLNEADPVRRHRLQLALEGKAADLLTLWTTDPTLAALKEKLAPTFVRSASPASRMIDEFKATDAYKNLSMDAKAAVLIVQDEMQGGYTKKWDHLVSTAFEDANRIQYLKRSAEARGVSVEVVGVNSWGEDAKKMVSEAGRSLVLLDPAYHGTSTGTYSVEGFTGDLGSTEALKLNVEGAKAMSDGNVVIYHNKATPEVGKQMRSAFGDKLFDNVWERSNGQPEFLGIFDGKGDGIDVDAMRKATPTVPVAEQTVTAQEGAAGTDIAAAEAAPEESTRPATTAERIETRLREGEPLVGLRYLVNKLARQFVEQGITDRDALVDAVHGVLSSIDPSIDRQTAADAISGYGAFRPYAGDEVARTLRDLKGQLLQLGKLASMEKGEAPKRTGSERPPASDEERRLIQRVNEEKKKGFADTATSLKSVLSSIATRFRNQIRDLDYQIQTRTRIVPTERPTPTSPEIEALRVERDRLQAIVDEIFAPQGPPAPDPITRRLQRQIDDLNQRLAEGNLEAKKVEHQGPQTENVMRLQAERERLQAELDDRRKAARPARSQEDIDAAKLRSLIKITERSITEIQAKLDSGNVGPDAQTPSTVTSPELEALRARRDAMREELNLARRALRPRVTPEQRAIQANRTRLANELARLRERIFYGEIERPTRQQKKSPRTLSDQELALQTEIRMERGKWAQILEQDRLAHRTRVERLKDAVKEVRDLPRALKASWDVSAVLRQGGFFALAHPVETATHLGPMLKALADPKYALAIDTALRSRDLAAFGDSSRLELTAIDGSLTKQEEGLRSRWSDRIPGIPASNRAFITLLNLVRASRFDAMVRAVPGTATIEQGRALANMVNVATGRGNPGKLGALVNAASYILWSPRLLLSRFQLIAGQPFYGGDASTRKIIAKEYARSLLGVAAVFSLAALAGSDPPEEDPRSTDFGKIKFGNTRIDPLAGLSQVTVLLSRLTSGEKKSLSGRVKAIRGDVEYGSDDSADILGRFFRTKLTPVLGTTVNVLSGKDVVGREVTPLTVATDLVVPLTFGDIYESMKEHGIAGGAALGVLSAFGMGVQTIEQHKPEAETSTAAHN